MKVDASSPAAGYHCQPAACSHLDRQSLLSNQLYNPPATSPPSASAAWTAAPIHIEARRERLTGRSVEPPPSLLSSMSQLAAVDSGFLSSLPCFAGC